MGGENRHHAGKPQPGYLLRGEGTLRFELILSTLYWVLRAQNEVQHVQASYIVLWCASLVLSTGCLAIPVSYLVAAERLPWCRDVLGTECLD
jgi:hypothetical protein